MEHHQKLMYVVFHYYPQENNFSGMTPADADLALLETARRCDYYGIKLHSATVGINIKF